MPIFLHDIATGKSVTTVLCFVNTTPTDWFSKRQATVEAATYGSEFVAAKTATAHIIDLRNTLRYLSPHHEQGIYVWRQQVCGREFNHTSINPQQKTQYVIIS